MLKDLVRKVVSRNDALYGFLWGLRKRPLTEFYSVGFHGDTHLIDFISPILSSVDQFIETGTSVASTTRYVAEKFPHLHIYGCEPDRNAFDFSMTKLKDYKNVLVKRQTSPEFLYELTKNNPSILEKDTIFWLDSHANGFKWPLRDEVMFITSYFSKGYIFIDDFLVPENPQFGYDEYDGQVCSLEYIKDMLDGTKKYEIYYPAYKDRTSEFCKLRGWVMIEFGHSEGMTKEKPGMYTKVS